MFWTPTPGLHRTFSPLYWAVSTRGLIDPMEVEWEKILIITLEAHNRHIRGEIEAGLAGLPESGPDGERLSVLVLGSGSELPVPASRSNLRFTLCNFDPELLHRAAQQEVAGVAVVTAPAIGMRTVFADQSLDRVVITSRLAALWPAWGEYVLREAARVGREVRTPFLP